MNGELLSLLRNDLTRSRTLEAKDAENIIIHLGVEDPLTGITCGQLIEREDWEVEVLISPMFTPNQEQRIAYEAVLLAEGVTQPELNQLIAALVNEKISCEISFGGTSCVMPVPEVVLRRYVRLLHLDGQVPSGSVNLLKAMASPCDYRAAMALARQPVWRSLKNRELLVRCLEKMALRQSFSINKLDFLTEHVHQNRPENIRELVHGLDALVDAYQKDQYRPVFDLQLREFQANAIRPRFCGTQVKAFRTSMAKALLSDFREPVVGS